MIKLLTLICLLLCSCDTPGYKGLFQNVTDYPIEGEYKISPTGIKVFTTNNTINLNDIDLQVYNLETCLQISIHRDWFVVYIPSDWYVSVCSGEQLIPS